MSKISVFSASLLLSFLSFHAYAACNAGVCTNTESNGTVVTKMGSTEIINSGPATVTQLGNNVTIINSPHSAYQFTIPGNHYGTILYPNGSGYAIGSYYGYGGYPVQIAPPPYSNGMTCNAYGCY